MNTPSKKMAPGRILAIYITILAISLFMIMLGSAMGYVKPNRWQVFVSGSLGFSIVLYGVHLLLLMVMKNSRLLTIIWLILFVLINAIMVAFFYNLS